MWWYILISIETNFNSSYSSIKLDTKLNPAYGENILATNKINEVYYSEIKEVEAAASYEYVSSLPPEKTNEYIYY